MNCYGLLLMGFGGQIGLGPGVAKETSVSFIKLQTGEKKIKIREQKVKKGERRGKLVTFSD